MATGVSLASSAYGGVVSDTKTAPCGHCDHQTANDYHGMWNFTSYRCCHCGRTWEHQVRNQSQGWFSSHQDKHGPHAPVVTVTF